MLKRLMSFGAGHGQATSSENQPGNQTVKRLLTFPVKRSRQSAVSLQIIGPVYAPAGAIRMALPELKSERRKPRSTQILHRWLTPDGMLQTQSSKEAVRGFGMES